MVKIQNYDPYETDIKFDVEEGDVTVKTGFADFGKDDMLFFSKEIKKGDYYIYSKCGRDFEIFDTEAKRMLNNFLQNNKMPVYIETWAELRDKLNAKFKNSPNFVSYTVEDITKASAEQITNWKNCL